MDFTSLRYILLGVNESKVYCKMGATTAHWN